MTLGSFARWVAILAIVAFGSSGCALYSSVAPAKANGQYYVVGGTYYFVWVTPRVGLCDQASRAQYRCERVAVQKVESIR